ncbi:MAG TPA: nitrilase-related carbon-nitrogen hydrolase, partial [Candidatus Omnitrophota bacterium]|nr:nitrilase-related carbon-nitrogen hydrolase [Candidatus Omnitrophota bacterium]
MKRKLRVACIQVDASQDWEENLRHIGRLTDRALRQKADLVVFPETFCCRAYPSQYPFIANELSYLLVRGFQEKAKKSGVAFLLGSVIESSSRKKYFFNTSFLISEKGDLVAKYRKIHLFDINLKKKIAVRESKDTLPG